MASTSRSASVPDTVGDRPARVAPTLRGSRRAAADRLDAVLTSVGERAVTVHRRRRRLPNLAALSSDGLRSWFDDARVAGGEARDAKLAASLSAAALERSGTLPALRPTAAQVSALGALDAASLAGLEATWNAIGGTPRRIRGPLYAGRGVTERMAAEGFVAASWSTLGALLGAGSGDRLERVSEGSYEHRSMVSTVFRRVHDGEPVPQNLVEVLVTDASHVLGRGVVHELRIAWDRSLVAMPIVAARLTEADALAIARVVLDVDPASPEPPNARLQLWCLDLGTKRRCGPTWRVFWRTRGMDIDAAPGAFDDTVYIDAETGEVLWSGEQAQHGSGYVNVTSNFPYDTVDQYRDYRWAELKDWYYPVYSNTDDVGYYNFTPSLNWIGIRLFSRGFTPMAFKHELSYSCSPVPDGRDRAFVTGTSPTFTVPPSPSNGNRTDFTGFAWGIYLAGMFSSDFANQAELPQTVWYDAKPSSGGRGQMSPCDGVAEMAAITFVSGPDDAAYSRYSRDVFGEEFTHTVQWCTQTVGPGCGNTDGPTRRVFAPGAWDDGDAGALAVWFTEYDNNRRGASTTRELTYQGPGVLGDIVLHDTEIEGTGSDSMGCRPPGYYPCTGDEACWPGAHDKPRCMKRGTSLANCVAQFPGEGLIDWQPYGFDALNTPGIPICVSNDYANSRIFYNIGVHLIQAGGYRGGIAAMIGANRNLAGTRMLTTTSDNYHEVMASHAGQYEASDAFHDASAQVFPWLDDTTGQPTHAEAIRTPRVSTLVFTNGGPTGAPLAFQHTYDFESFMLPVNPGGNYEVSATTASTNVDLCISIYDWITGAWIASAAGCTDGSGSLNRNANVFFATGSAQERVEVFIYNVLFRTGSYDLRVRSVADDYPDGLSVSDCFTSEPLPPGTGVLAVMGGSDVDLFRYDVPTGATGALTFTATGFSPAPMLYVYYASGTGLPTGPPLVSGAGSVNIPSPLAGRYYVQAAYNGKTGYYTMQATQTGCSTCNTNGTYTAPEPLPTTIGGMVWNRLDHGAQEPGYDTWAACRDGSSCDWYSIVLNGNQRVTMTTYDVLDSWCDVDVAVFAPPEQTFFQGAGDDRYPVVVDHEGSMELYGSQLTFVARRAGTYRVRVRAAGAWNCPRYRMTVALGPQDYYAPPSIH